MWGRRNNSNTLLDWEGYAHFARERNVETTAILQYGRHRLECLIPIIAMFEVVRRNNRVEFPPERQDGVWKAVSISNYVVISKVRLSLSAIFYVNT